MGSDRVYDKDLEIGDLKQGPTPQGNTVLVEAEEFNRLRKFEAYFRDQEQRNVKSYEQAEKQGYKENVQKDSTEMDRLKSRLERLLNSFSDSTERLIYVNIRLCIDNTPEPVQDRYQNEEPRTVIENFDYLIDMGDRISDKLRSLIEFQEKVI